ncbi:hypothetical protein M0R45_038153 [Rubus argutus]|uniref:Protein kinase domain-containing protein n=1 Tax=Rubus argutus TaxID=59490 RepID=A0AAW1W2G1_RUBAR
MASSTYLVLFLLGSISVCPMDEEDKFQLAIWFAELPGDRVIVWSANRNSAVTNNAIMELETTGNLVLMDAHFVKPCLDYNRPESTYNTSPESYYNNSYWNGPDISNVTGDVVAILDEAGSFGIVYGDSSDGAVYVYKNDGDDGGLSAVSNKSNRLSVLRRLTLETNGNLRLYRWDDDVNGSRQWVPEWAAVSNPCDISGICGNGICTLDRTKTNASCTCLPGTYKVNGEGQCSENSSLIGKCDSKQEYQPSHLRADDEKAYCWVVRSMDFGGFQDPGATLFVKVRSNGLVAPEGETRGSGDSSDGSAAGTGGFGSVYKGSLADGTLVAVKKLERVLPHGEKEFITEVNTIGSMHHMNLVRLCGYCSEASQRYGMLLLEIIGGRRNLDMSFDAVDFFYPGWAFKELTSGEPLKVADRRLEGAVEEEELIRALKTAFWCIQDEVFMRPTMGEVVRMLDGSVETNMPPMPQTVLELIEEGLDHVYRAMKREVTNHFSSFTINTHLSSQATCSYSTMSPR